ncbi:MAG: M20/M25/M40 family metallo-hydrolase [Pseudomonadales bacterium]|nr:M20/M25/M40 family metallo-hydrolase [Pseudomonadales bacterium]
MQQLIPSITLPFRSVSYRTRLMLMMTGLCLFLSACSPTPEKLAKDTQPGSDPTFSLLKDLIAIETWRQPDRSNEAATLANLDKIKQILWQDLQHFNSQQKNLKFRITEWKKNVDGEDRWVYSFRIGEGENLVSIISHLDTVAPGSADWRPFELREEQRAYTGLAPQTFLVGRGAIDDKGPGVFALDAIKAIARDYDNNPSGLGNNTIEMLFDTSEETSMSMPHYFNDCPDCEPDFGIVFDSKWCVRAEKGIERPLFFIDSDGHENTSNKGIIVKSINTFNNPTNQIPGKVHVTFLSPSSALIKKLKSSIEQQYQQAIFDDADYQKAKMLIVEQENTQELHIEFQVAGAQHGSIPEVNRAGGANPLVSALNLIDTLSKSDNAIESNSYSQLAQFSSWMWGTQVLGEHHDMLLAKDDGVFSPGTTYAITKIQKENHQGKDKLSLSVDIRFSMDHHDNHWNGEDGTIAGQSQFASIFSALTEEYKNFTGQSVNFSTKMLYAPDIRNPDNHFLQSVNTAYKKVTGEDCPMTAIGGGTDAKGHAQLVAVGPLFKPVMAYPVNYHGLNEAAPLNDLIKSREILIEILKQEIEKK